MFKWFWTIFSLGAPEETADISRRHNWFPREMTSEEWAEKFHDNDVSLSGYNENYKDLSQIYSANSALQANVRFSPFWSHLSTISAKTAQSKGFSSPRWGPFQPLGRTVFYSPEGPHF